MNSVIEQIEKYKIVPVVKLDREEDAIPLAQALIAGGLSLAEVTFRTEAAEGSIAKSGSGSRRCWSERGRL